MSGVGVVIQAQGMDRIQATVKGIEERVGRPVARKRLLVQILGTVESQTRKRIDEGGPDPSGRPWPKLSADYQRWKRKHSSGKILNLFGPLRDSLMYDAGEDEGQVGSNLDDAAIHQLGGDIQRGARSITVRHRTTAKGELMRTALFGGKGLIFANAAHKRVLERTYQAEAYTIHMPARPYLGLSPENLDELEQTLDAWADSQMGAARA